MLLAEEFKEGTKTEHRNAEKSTFVKYFLRGEISREVYGKFLSYLYHVYCRLEKCVELHKDNEHIRHVYFPDELDRKEAIEQDLEFFQGVSWRETINEPLSSPALQAYLEAIDKCSSENPTLLVAHLYTRYLGDLSGGQILAKRLNKHMNLKSGRGTAFYRFDQIETPKLFKQVYRGRLNQIQMSKALLAASVEEARLAFNLNIGIFIEFDPEAGKVDSKEYPDDSMETVTSMNRTGRGKLVQKETLYFLWITLMSLWIWKLGYIQSFWRQLSNNK